MRLPALAIVGTGPVALAVGRAHTDAGGRVMGVVSRDDHRGRSAAAAIRADGGGADLTVVCEAEVVLVAVADAAVAAVGARLGDLSLPSECLVLHTSGALSGGALAVSNTGTGSLHPLQSLARPETMDSDPAGGLARQLRGAHWFHEGSGSASARLLVGAWGGTFHPLAVGAKALYHAGAAVLSNHAVALFDAATELFEAAGVPGAESRAPLASLLLGTARNLGAVGTPNALTGPIARGDVTTVRDHLAALRASAPHLVASYVEMARVTVTVAEAQGLAVEPAAELRALLDQVSEDLG